jgi:multiple sugar transport system ATP-binding protein
LTVAGEAIASERFGADRIAYVQSEAGLLAVRVPGAAPRAGERVTLSAPASALSFFDTTGRLIAAGEPLSR